MKTRFWFAALVVVLMLVPFSGVLADVNGPPPDPDEITEIDRPTRRHSREEANRACKGCQG